LIYSEAKLDFSYLWYERNIVLSPLCLQETKENFRRKYLSAVNLACMTRGSGGCKHKNCGLRYNTMQFGTPVPAASTFSTGIKKVKSNPITGLDRP
jgi:hypothetical protein